VYGPHETSAVVRRVYVCYFLSGALGLAYQILWLRKLLLVFGSTVHAVSTVPTVFFGGLALGSWLFGRLIDRRGASAGLRWYAALEAGVGLYAFITPWLFDTVRHLYIPIYQASGFSPTALVAASFACSALILLVPTTLLGGTFPVLGRFLIRSGETRGGTIAGLYAINTAGAMAGTLLVYYVGLPVLGLARTLVCAGIVNVGIGALCLSFDRRLQGLGFWITPSAAAPDPAEARRAPLGDLRWVFMAFALSGFSAMAYEVTWTRALSLVLGSSIYAFCIMLATFLGGIALGSAFARRALRARPATVERFISLELLLGGYGLLSVWLFSQLPDWFVALWPLTGRTFAGLSWLQVSLSAVIMLPPTIVMGVLFPVVSDLVTERFAQLGQRLGTAYAVNTLGGIVGSFLTGFALIPWLGLPWAIVIAAGVNLIAAVGLYLRFGGRGTLRSRLGLSGVLLAQAAALGAVVIVPSWQRQVFVAGVYLHPEAFAHTSVERGVAGSKLLYYRDGLNTTVSVHQDEETIFLRVGGKTDASSGVDMGTQALSAHIPLLMHPDPKRVLVIGLGSGVTMGHVGRHPVSTIHCAEIEPAVIEGARYFKAYNYGIHDDPRARIFDVDGRNFLLASPETYDVIVSEPSNPWMAGLAYLFTQEFYELAKRRLAPNGLMCQWLQLYGIFPSDVKLLMKTFHAAFPHVSVWSPISGDVLLVGSMTPQQFDYRQLAERMASPAIHEGLAVVLTERPEVLLQLFWLGTQELEALTADISWVHQDDQPSVEFNAPKSLYSSQAFRINYAGLERFKSHPRAIAPGYDRGLEDAGFYDALAAMWSDRGQEEKAQEALEQAVRLDPSSSKRWMRLGELALKRRQPLKAKEALRNAIQADPAHIEVYRLLATLHWEQGQLPEAQGFYEQALRLRAPDGAFAAEFGRFLQAVGQLPLAVEYYRSALSQGGEDQAPLLRAYSEALMELNSWDLAEQALRVAAAAFPSDGSFPLLLGKALLGQGLWRDAEPWFRQAASAAPGTAEAYVGLGRVALARGDGARAAQWFRRALAYAPYHHETAYLLYEMQRGRPEAEVATLPD